MSPFIYIGGSPLLSKHSRGVQLVRKLTTKQRARGLRKAAKYNSQFSLVLDSILFLSDYKAIIKGKRKEREPANSSQRARGGRGGNGNRVLP
eukprot:1320183-Amorphochlora_amoeboformis.AAC.1